MVFICSFSAFQNVSQYLWLSFHERQTFIGFISIPHLPEEYSFCTNLWNTLFSIHFSFISLLLTFFVFFVHSRTIFVSIQEIWIFSRSIPITKKLWLVQHSEYLITLVFFTFTIYHLSHLKVCILNKRTFSNVGSIFAFILFCSSD